MNIQKGWQEIQLVDVLDYEQPNEYIIKKPLKKDENLTPVLTANKSFIKGYTDERNGIYNNLPVIIFDDFTADTKFVDFPFKVKSSAMKILKSKNKNILLKFVFYQMQLNKMDTTTHRRYYISKYQDLKFLFPTNKDNTIDLQKQIIIVSEIEKQLTRLEESIKSLNDIKKNIDIYRMSVLKSVFAGNILSKDNFETKQIDVLGLLIGVCASWKIGKISDLGEYRRGKSKHRPRDDPILYGGKYPFIQTGEITNAKTRLTAYLKTYNEEGLRQSKLWKKGTLCITIAANIAYTAILDFDACFPDSVVGFTSSSETTAYFVMYYIKYIQSLIESKASATAQKNINIATLSEIAIPVLNIDTQSKIVEEIESKFSIAEKIENVSDQSIFKVKTLKSSILKEAFEGNLVKFEEQK